MKRLKRKNILFLTPKFPYPPDEGGKIDTLSNINILSKKYNLYLFYIGNKDENEKILYQKYQIKQIFHSKKNTENNIFELVKNIFSRVPYTFGKYYIREAYEKIEGAIKRQNINIVFIDHLHLAPYGISIKKKFPWVKVILREHNTEYIFWRRVYKEEKNFFKKIVIYLQTKKVFSYEAKTSPFFDLCLMVSLLDEKRLKDISPRTRTNVLTVAMDIPNNLDRKKDNIIPESLIYVGNFSWSPNKYGILWFLNNVWPNIKKEFLRAKLFIIGKNPSREILTHRGKDVVVTGYVKDIHPLLLQSEVFLVPLFSGGGIRIKILKAMAMGKPTISTSLGAEGIPARHKKEIIIADNKEEFMDGIKLLFNNYKLREILSKNAKELIRINYSFQNVSKKLYKIIDNLK